MILRTASTLVLAVLAAFIAPPDLGAQVTHANPVTGGADPFVTRHGGNYYFLRTTGGDIKIRRSPTLQGIGSGTETTVFWFNHEIKGHIWAPELHYLNGKWYIYATGSLSSSQFIMRMFVLEGNSQDPMGSYTYRRLLDAHTGALDQTPLVGDADGALFLVWSQWDDAGQSLYIGPLGDPVTLGHPRVRISTPDHAWERNGNVNEGPIVLKRGGRTMIGYSGLGVNQPPTAHSGTIHLEGGQFHPLRLEYFEGIGGAGLTLRWAPPGAATPVVIPAERLFPHANGLRGDYFSGANFGTHVLTRLDPAVAFDWGLSLPDLGLPVDGFSVRWTGRVRAPATGAYTFHTRSDDGVRLWVAGARLIDDWNAHPVTENSGTVYLSAGLEYDLILEYFDEAAGAVCELLWTPPGGTRAVIPADALFPPGTGNATELPVVPPGDSLWTGAFDGQFGTAGNWTAGVPAASADAWFASNALNTAVAITSHPSPRRLRMLRFMPGAPAFSIASGGSPNGDRLDLGEGGGIEIQAGMGQAVDFGGLGFFRSGEDREIRITHHGTGILTLPANISRAGNARLSSVRVDGSGTTRAKVLALVGGTVTKSGIGTLEFTSDLTAAHATRLDVRDSGAGRVRIAADRSVALAGLALAANRTLAGPAVPGESATLVLNDAADTIHGSITGNLAVIKQGPSVFTVSSTSSSPAAQAFQSLEIRGGVWKTERAAVHAPANKVGGGPVTVLDGGALELAGAEANETGAYPNALTLSGTTANQGRGALATSGIGDKHWNGPITLAGAARISHDTTGSLVLGGPLAGVGHALELFNDRGTLETRGGLALGGGGLLKQGGGLVLLAGPAHASGPGAGHGRNAAHGARRWATRSTTGSTTAPTTSTSRWCGWRPTRSSHGRRSTGWLAPMPGSLPTPTTTASRTASSSC